MLILTAASSPFLLVGFLRAWAEYNRIEAIGWWHWLWKNHHKKCVYFLLLFIPQFIVGGLNYSGMCIAQGRWLSGEEKIKLAISEIVFRGSNINYLPDKDWEKFSSYDELKFASVDEFIKNNHDCCKTLRGTNHPALYEPFFGKITGHYNDTVEVKYTANFIDKNKNIIRVKDHKEYPVIRNCGYTDNSLAD